MRCHHCHQENTVAGAFCMHCGQALHAQAATVAAGIGGGYCPQCGTPRRADAQFCEQCGDRFNPEDFAGIGIAPAAVASPPSPAPLGTPPRSGSGWVWFGAFAAAMLVAFGGAAAWWLSRQAPDSAPVAQTAALDGEREAAFRHFTRGLEMAEALEQGSGDENTLVEALEQAETATRLDASTAAYWHLLGYLYAKLSEDQLGSIMAEDALAKAIALNTANASSRLLLARLLLAREAYSAALDQLEAVARREPKSLTSLLAADMCRAYVADEQAARGETFFREMAKARPDSSAVKLALAIVLQAQGQGQVAPARQQLAELLANPSSAPDDVEHARKLEQLWQGGGR